MLVPNLGSLTINDGNGGANYVLASQNASGVITPASLTLTGTPSNKSYDGTTAASGAPLLAGLVLSDTASGAGFQSFENKHVGTSKALTPSLGSILINDGNGGNNYALILVPSFSGAITPAALTVAAGTEAKTYDGTTQGSSIPTITGGTLFAGDIAQFVSTYASRNVGTGITVTPTGTINDGNNGGNYIITRVSNSTGSITPALLTITSDFVQRRVGAQNPEFTGTVSGFLGGDTFASATTGSLEFDTDATAVSPEGEYAINGSGLGAANYTFAQADSNGTALEITNSLRGGFSGPAFDPASVASRVIAPLPNAMKLPSLVIGMMSPQPIGDATSQYVADDGISLRIVNGEAPADKPEKPAREERASQRLARCPVDFQCSQEAIDFRFAPLARGRLLH